MIKIELPSTRPKKTYTSNNYNNTPAGNNSSYFPAYGNNKYVTESSIDLKQRHKQVFEEAIRRNLIITQLVKSLKYKVGDRVQIVKENDRDGYGHEIYVTNILDTYGKFGKDEVWPSSDDPMIVHCYSKDLNSHFICTVGYVEEYKT